MQRGFTLSEILVGFAITGVLAVVATPALMHGTHKMQTHTRTQMVVGMLEQARRAALTGQAPVVVCSGSSSGCLSDWTASQLAVFADTNRSEDLDNSDRLMQVFPVKDTRLVWRGFRKGVFIGFDAQRGTARNSGSLYLCPLNGGEAQRILLHNSGRVRHEPCHQCQACVL